MDAHTSPGELDLTAVFAALPGATAVFAADPPRFTVLAVSEALLSVAQRPRDAVVGRPLAEAFPNSSPEDSRASRLPGLLASVEAAVRTGAPQRMDRQRHDLPRPDGAWEAHYWDVVNIPVPGPDGAVRYVLHQLADVTAQVHHEAAAARAERRAERIIERMGDAHYVLDREFRIESVNAATERLLGVPRAALVGRSHWEAFPASLNSPIGRAFQRVVAEGVEQHLTHHYTGEGYDLHLEVDAYPTDEGGLAMFWRDVTERVRAEAALRASEEKYRALFNEMDEAYAVVEVMADASGHWTDFLFLEVNPAFMRHTGMPYPVGRTATQLLGTPNPRWAELYGRAARTGESIRLEEPEVTLGRVFDLNIFRLGGEGSRRVAVLFTDITERKRAEEALRESERWLKATHENAPVFIHTVDHEGRYLYINETFTRLTGYTRQEILGRSVFDFMKNEAEREESRQRFTRLVRGETERYTEERFFINKRGEPLWVELTLGSVRDEAGRFLYAVRIAQDITQRKQVETALRESEERLRLFGDASSDVLWIRDAGTLRMEYVSPAFEAIYGAARETVQGRDPRSWAELLVPEDREVAVAALERVRAGERVTVEYRVRRPDGELRWLRNTDFPIPDANGRIGRIGGIGQDVTTEKKVETALRESEAKYRSLFESIDDGFGIIEIIEDEHGSPVDYRFVELNEAFERQTGLCGAAGRRGSEVHPGGVPEWLQTYAEVARTGEPKRFERHHEATRRWYDVSATRVGADGSRRVAIVFADTTERREREERHAFLLRFSDALRVQPDEPSVKDQTVRMLAEHLRLDRCFISEVFREQDIASVGPEHIRADDPPMSGVYRLSEYPETMRQLASELMVIPDMANDPRFSESERALLTRLHLQALLVTPVRKGPRQLVWTLAASSITPRTWTESERVLLEEVGERAWATIERVRAEAAQRESEERFRMVADNIPPLAWTCDTLGSVTWYNQRWLDYTGGSFEDLKGWNWSKVLHPDHRERVVAGIKHSDETGEPWTDTIPLRGKDGQYRWFLSRAIPIHGEQGQIIRWFGTNTDVTELREANRAKDEFLAMLGHELRNPLAPIVSTLELMRMEGGRKFSKEREMMLRQARHLAALLDDLLDVSRLARGKVELLRKTLALDELVDRAVEAAGPLIEQRRHRLSVDVAPGLLVSADEKRMVQVISNLLNNAAHYTPPGGHVQLTGRRDGRSVVLRVRDDGVGIPAELLPRVFERFQQGPRPLDRPEGGLGLGLAIVSSLVQLHGGAVTAASEGLGKGSEFEVRLPAARARRAPTPRAKPDAGTRAAPAPGHRLLVVDDNRAIADTLTLLLTRSGHTVEKAYDGLTALAVATRFQPTIAILDIGLPDMSGYELARRLRKQKGFAAGKLVALTGYGGEADRQRSKRAGFAEHLAKPIELGDLLATLERLSTPSTPKGAPPRRRVGVKARKPPAPRPASTSSRRRAPSRPKG